MQAINRPFTQIINGSTQFIIPVFQRDYSWGDDQCEQLWNDVIDAAHGASDGGHFLGSIVYVATGDNAAGFTRWLVIDGQQRLATLTLLLTALRNHIEESGWVGDEDSPTVDRIDAYFLKNTQESGNRRPKLVLRRNDDATLRALIDGDEFPENHSEPILSAYELFRDLLNNVDPDLVYRGIAHLIVIDVTLDRHADNPQLVFESLNSTGVDLSQADLIRNFVLMRLPEPVQTTMYEKYWSKIELLFRGAEPALDSFVRDYIALRTEATTQTRNDQIYRVFRTESKGFEEEDGGLEGMLQDMANAARYYAAFNPGRASDVNLEEAMRNLRRLGPVAAILISKLYRCNQEILSLSAENFLNSIALIESYLFRRAICGLESRGYWTVFANVAHKIDIQQPFQSLQVEFARLRENYRFPSDEEFRQALTGKDLYGLRVCWHLLDRLENAGSNELSDTSKYSIEHIMPQNQNLPSQWKIMLGQDWSTVHQAWLHRLGNLTLTGYNSTYSDRPFEEKKTIPGGFNESSVRLNKFVREQSQWTEKEINTRGDQLADRSVEIWQSLNVASHLVEEADTREMRELATRRDINQVSMSPEARLLFEALSNEVNGLGDVIELAESKSVSYHAPYYFLEVIPRKNGLQLLLSIDYSEVDNHNQIAEDANEKKFIPNAQHDGGVIINIRKQLDISEAMPTIRQAFNTPRLAD